MCWHFLREGQAWPSVGLSVAGGDNICIWTRLPLEDRILVAEGLWKMSRYFYPIDGGTVPLLSPLLLRRRSM